MRIHRALRTPLQAASCTYRIALGPRAAIVPGSAQQPSEHAEGNAQPSARLLKRVFDIDLEHCPRCGGEFKINAAIEEPAVIVRILTHLGLPARAPPRSPARLLALLQAA